MAGGVGNTPAVNAPALAVASAPTTLPDQQKQQNAVEPASGNAPPPAPAAPAPVHDPAVTIAPSVAAATLGLKPGDALPAQVIGADQDGRPVLQTADGVFIADTQKTLPAGATLDIAVADVGHQVTVVVLAENGEALPVPVKLELILVQLPDSGKPALLPAPPPNAGAPNPAAPQSSIPQSSIPQSSIPQSPAPQQGAPPGYRPPQNVAQMAQNFQIDGEDLSILTSAARWTPPALPPADAPPPTAAPGGPAAAAPPPPGAKQPVRPVTAGPMLDISGVIAAGQTEKSAAAQAGLSPAAGGGAARPAAAAPPSPSSAAAQGAHTAPARTETAARPSAEKLSGGQFFTARIIAPPPGFGAAEFARAQGAAPSSGQAELARLGRLPAGQGIEISLQPRPQQMAAETGPRAVPAAYARPQTLSLPPAQDAGPRQIALTGTVVALPAAPGAPPMAALSTPLGLLTAPELAQLPPGAIVTIGARLPAAPMPPALPAPTPAEPAVAAPLLSEAAAELPSPQKFSEHWPALGQIAAALQQQNPALAAALADRLPGLNSRLPRNLAFFLLAAGRGGDWLGADAAAALTSAGKSGLLDQLRGEFMGRGAPGPAGEWQAMTAPFDIGGRVIALPMWIRPFDHRPAGQENGKKSADGRSGTRFLLDLQLSRLGQVQIDGMAQSRRLDIILRSGRELPGPVRQGIAGSFYRALEGQSLTGSLTFRSDPIPLARAAQPGLAPSLKI